MRTRHRANLVLALAFLLSALPASAAFAAEVAVDITNFLYVPEQVEVAVGDTVTWTNNDPEPHTVTSLPGAAEEFNALLQQGESFSFTFTEDGFNPYFCEIHPGMRGDVLVGEAERPDPLDTSPIEADDNTAASIAYSQRAFPETGSGTALIGRDDVFADSLASGGLQGSMDAPLLLTDPDELDPRVAEELERLGVDTVIVLGGTQALAPAVEQALTAAGHQVTRLSGATRIETAVDVAGEVEGPPSAILARAYAAGADQTQAFADSLGAGALAAATARPVLLSETDHLSAATASYLEERDVESVTVVGGEAALSAQVVSDLEGLGIEVERLGGRNRVETAAAVAAAAVSGGAVPEAAVVVDGQDPNAWASGFPAAVLRAPVVLADGEQLPAPTTAFFVQLGSQRLAPLCGAFLSGTPCERATAAATSPPFPGGDVRLAVLEGANVVDDDGDDDQGDPEATAAVTIFPTASETTLCYDYSAMLEVTEGGIFRAPAGENAEEAAVTFDVAPGPFGLPAGCSFDLDEDVVSDILDSSDEFYASLATEDFPGGAVRGQVFAPTFLAAGEMSGAQEVPGPGEEEAGGFGGVVGKSATEVCVFQFLSPLSSAVTAAHIHEAPAGEAGDIVLPLRTPVAPGETYSCHEADAALVTALQTNASNYYINVHTEDLPAGAIRGQLGNFAEG